MKVTLDMKVLNKINARTKKAIDLTAEALIDDIIKRQVLPFDVGSLQNTICKSKVRDSVMKIVFDQPYARRLYYHPEYNFNKENNPNAQGEWLETYINGERKDFVKDTFKRILVILEY